MSRVEFSGSEVDLETLVSVAASDDLEAASEALGEIYDRYSELVFRVIRRRVWNDYAAAEDAAQQTWLKVAANVEQYREQGKFLNWLLAIAYNAAATQNRVHSRRAEVLTAEMLAVGGPDVGGSPEDTAIASAQAEIIAAAVQQLREAQKQCVIHRYYDGLTWAEVAQIMGKSEVAVRALHFRALPHLQRAISAAGLQRAPARVVATAGGVAC